MTYTGLLQYSILETRILKLAPDLERTHAYGLVRSELEKKTIGKQSKKW